MLNEYSILNLMVDGNYKEFVDCAFSSKQRKFKTNDVRSLAEKVHIIALCSESTRCGTSDNVK